MPETLNDSQKSVVSPESGCGQCKVRQPRMWAVRSETAWNDQTRLREWDTTSNGAHKTASQQSKSSDGSPRTREPEAWALAIPSWRPAPHSASCTYSCSTLKKTPYIYTWDTGTDSNRSKMFRKLVLQGLQPRHPPRAHCTRVGQTHLRGVLPCPAARVPASREGAGLREARGKVPQPLPSLLFPFPPGAPTAPRFATALLPPQPHRLPEASAAGPRRRLPPPLPALAPNPGGTGRCRAGTRPCQGPASQPAPA